MRSVFVSALALTLAVSAGPACAQRRAAAPSTSPEARLQQADLAAHLRFLASDELMGRQAGTPGNDVAARYVAEAFRRAGARPAPGTTDYFQTIPFVRTTAPRAATLVFGADTLRAGGDLAVLAGGPVDAAGEAVFVGYGAAAADYAGKSVRGRIVVARVGTEGEASPQAALRASVRKRALADSLGATALVELYGLSLPWATLRGNLGRPRFGVEEGGPARLPHAWANGAGGARAAAFEAGTVAVRFTSEGTRAEPRPSRNVAAFIEGTDARLKNEVVALTAHFDHVGAGMTRGAGATAEDSIFNGARDNGIGTVALIAAAEALAAAPPKRSVLLVAYTAEEDGLLGSRYFAAHPLVPLDRLVYNLNVDGAGVSDTTVVTVIGWGRTGGDAAMTAALAPFGLSALPDPAPEQGLFDRSDNVALAAKGIPAPTFSPGFRAFTDPGVANFYHRPADEADETFPFGYLLRFSQAYARTARLIADAPARPRWAAGDKYEAAARALYGAAY